MNTNRRTATLVGTLFLVAMAASLIGGAMVEGVLAQPDVLERLAAGTGTLTVGVGLELVNALAVLLIAAALYPLIRRHADRMALGYVALRVLEAVALTAAAFIPLALATLWSRPASADPAAAVGNAALGDRLVAMRADLTGIMVPLFFCLGALLLYAWLYRSRVLPRFIAVWGFAGVLGIAALNVFGIGATAGLLLALPIILNELFLGGWLLLRGFSAAPVPSGRSVPA